MKLSCAQCKPMFCHSTQAQAQPCIDGVNDNGADSTIPNMMVLFEYHLLSYYMSYCVYGSDDDYLQI
jgi:hypothetical protein